MSHYPEYLSEKRKAAKTPKFIVENGKVHYGTFDSQFENLNLIDVDSYNGKKSSLGTKKKHMVEWEAFEIDMDQGTLISAVYKMFPTTFTVFFWYDKATKKVTRWRNLRPFNVGHVATQLIDDNSYLSTKNSNYCIYNDLGNGKASAKGFSKSITKGQIEIDIKLERLSPIANGVMPLAYKKGTKEFCNPLYSEKDFFKASGVITVNGKKYISNQNTVGIIDDHKGFYPYKAHYDWLTTMGRCEIDGQMKYLAFNLTRNQSVNQDDYNENVLWLENQSFALPPVYFTHKENKKNAKTWYIKDKHGDVDLQFVIEDKGTMNIKAGIIDVDYSLPFGKIYGYIKDHNGKKYTLDGMTGVGEDKTSRM